MTNEKLQSAKKIAETFNATLSVLVENDSEELDSFLNHAENLCFKSLLVHSRKFLKNDKTGSPES